MNETVAANNKRNVLRKDEVVDFGNRELLLQNAPSQDEGMFRIPKVIN
jgi:aspartyl/glutamyl-tRNA(Asn/Gln) amidotransferase C subunit